MGDWTQESPGDGDTGQLSGAATDLATKKTAIDTVVTDAGGADAAVSSEVWSGASTDAWRTRLTTGRERIGELAGVFASVQSALDAYVTRVAEIKTAAEPWKQQAWQANYTANTPVIMSPDATADERYEAFAPQRRAQNELQEAQTQLALLANQREEADSTCVAAISTALPADWPATYSALVAAGFTSMDDVGNTAAVQRALVDLAQGINDGSIDPADAEALSAMLALYGEDETIMSRYYTELGGEGTVNLIDAVGTWAQDNPDQLATALALAAFTRSGLAVGSRNWSERQGEQFAAGMFEAGEDKGDSIGYLFNGGENATLGLTLAVATADEIDRMERVEHITWFEQGGGNYLSVMELGEDGNRVNDASGPIFSTLGQYPDAAYEWLTGGAGDDRVQYWYHDRYDHMHWVDAGRQQPMYIAYAHDSFQGVSELFYGAQQATGGPLSPDIAGGVANPRDAAGLAASIMTALVGNDDFNPGNLNNEASAALAGAFVLNLPALSEYPLSANFPSGVDGTSWGYQLPDGSTLHIPVVGEDVLAEFLAFSSSHPAGHQIITESVTAYQETLLNVAMGSGNPQAMEDALHRITDLQAALVAADYGLQLDGAVRSDERTEDIVSGVSLVVGALPVPPILSAGFEGGTKFVLDWSQSMIVGGSSGQVTNSISDALATQTEQVLAEIEAGREGAFDDIARVTMATSVYEYFAGMDAANAGVPGYEPIVEGIPAPPSGSDGLDDWYLAHSAELQQDLGAHFNAGAANPFPSNYFDTIANDYDDKIGSWIGYFRD